MNRTKTTARDIAMKGGGYYSSATTGAKESPVEGGRRGVRKTMIVAPTRKLLIALRRMVTTGEVPAGVLLHPAR